MIMLSVRAARFMASCFQRAKANTFVGLKLQIKHK